MTYTQESIDKLMNNISKIFYSKTLTDYQKILLITDFKYALDDSENWNEFKILIGKNYLTQELEYILITYNYINGYTLQNDYYRAPRGVKLFLNKELTYLYDYSLFRTMKGLELTKKQCVDIFNTIRATYKSFDLELIEQRNFPTYSSGHFYDSIERYKINFTNNDKEPYDCGIGKMYLYDYFYSGK